MDSNADPIALVEQLEPDDLRRQIAELDRRRRALVVPLRAAVVRERRGRRGPMATAGREGQHGSP
jgi:hypothetical protein